MSKVQTFNLLHVNCRSINKNFKGLTNLLHGISQELSVVAISETWLNATNEDCFSICGYNYASKIRIGRDGGGVGMYINNALVYCVREDLSRMLPFV